MDLSWDEPDIFGVLVALPKQKRLGLFVFTLVYFYRAGFSILRFISDQQLVFIGNDGEILPTSLPRLILVPGLRLDFLPGLDRKIDHPFPV